MHGGVIGQLDGQPRRGQRPGIERVDGRVDLVEDLDGVRAALARQRQVIGGKAVAQCETARLLPLHADAGDVAQHHRPAIAVGDDQAAKLLDRHLAQHTHGVLAAADVGEAAGNIGGRAQRRHDVAQRDAHGRRALGVQRDAHVFGAAALQVDLGHAGDARQQRLDLAADQLMKFGRVARVVGALGAHQQRGRIAAGKIVAAHVDPGAVRVARQRRGLLQAVQHVQVGALHVGAEGKDEVDAAVARADVALQLAHAGHVAQHALLLLDDDRLHLAGGSAAPVGEDRDFGLFDRRQQLHREAHQGHAAGGQQQQGQYDAGGRIAQRDGGQIHWRSPCAGVAPLPARAKTRSRAPRKAAARWALRSQVAAKSSRRAGAQSWYSGT